MCLNFLCYITLYYVYYIVQDDGEEVEEMPDIELSSDPEDGVYCGKQYNGLLDP